MPPFALVLERCRVVDGTGAPWFRADVAVRGERIEAVGDLGSAEAAERVDARELFLSPGFVDTHVHTDAELLRDPAQEASLRQGVTTHVVGQDGFGFAPTTPRSFEFMRVFTSGINGSELPFGAASVAEFLERLDGATAVNAVTLMPNGCARLDVVGSDGREATPEELERMAAICRQAAAEGAVGLSSGLDYVPSCHASTAELAQLAAATGGVYVTHIRYKSGLLVALDEAIEIGRRAGVPVHVSHLRGDPTLGTGAASIVERLDAARSDGVDVTFDAYPYTYGATVLPYMLPYWLFAGDPEEILARLADPATRDRVRAELDLTRYGWDDMVIAADHPLAGASPEAAARELGKDVVDLVLDLLAENELNVTLIWKPTDRPEVLADIEALYAHPGAIVGSDGIYTPGRVHPRGWGAFARYLATTRLPLEEAVRHATSLPAGRFGLLDRGLVRPGCAADLVVFDPAGVRDRSTWDDGRRPAQGVRHVLVNGVFALRDGELTGATPGRGLRRASG
jgi:N-acyl-D-amino-acid deacylase